MALFCLVPSLSFSPLFSLVLFYDLYALGSPSSLRSRRGTENRRGDGRCLVLLLPLFSFRRTQTFQTTYRTMIFEKISWRETECKVSRKKSKREAKKNGRETSFNLPSSTRLSHDPPHDLHHPSPEPSTPPNEPSQPSFDRPASPVRRRASTGSPSRGRSSDPLQAKEVCERETRSATDDGSRENKELEFELTGSSEKSSLEHVVDELGNRLANPGHLVR